MTVLGVIFDSKLHWAPHVTQTINKARQALHAMKLIRPYFHTEELKQLLMANYFSILCYNSEIWHLPSLNPYLKQQLSAALAAGLLLCTASDTCMISYLNLHSLNNT